MNYKISLTAMGGEYCYGFISNDDEINKINEAIENDEEINLSNDYDDIEVNFYDYDQIVHIYGPAITDYLKINISTYENDEEIDFLTDCDNNSINYISLGNPMFDKENYELEENNLLFGGFYLEKNIELSVELELDDNETFELNNVFVGSINLDETLCNDEVISKVFYLNDKVQDEILELYNTNVDRINEYGKISCVKDAISDLLYYLKDYDSEEHQNALKLQSILDKNELYILDDIEGQGIHKFEYVVVRNLDNEILYERDLDL